MECEGPDDQPRLRVQGGMWKYSSKCQKKPRWMSSEISVLSPEDLSPWPPVSTYVFTCTSKDDRTAALQSAVQQVSAAPSLPYDPECGNFPVPQHEEYIPQSSSCSQARLTGVASQSSQPSLHHLPQSSLVEERHASIRRECFCRARTRRICRAVVFPDREGAACRSCCTAKGRSPSLKLQL